MLPLLLTAVHQGKLTIEVCSSHCNLTESILLQQEKSKLLDTSITFF